MAPRRKKRKQAEELDKFYWAETKHVPKGVLWPVRQQAQGYYSRADDAIIKCKIVEACTVRNIEQQTAIGRQILKRKKLHGTLQSFLADVEWAKKEQKCSTYENNEEQGKEPIAESGDISCTEENHKECPNQDKDPTVTEGAVYGSSQEKALNDTDEDCSQGEASNETAEKDSSSKIIQDIEPGLRGTSETFEQCSNQVEHSKIGSSQEKTLNETDVIEDCSQGEASNETAGKDSSPKIIQDIEPGLRGTNENVGQCSNQVETPISVSVSNGILSIELPFVPFEDLNDIDTVEEFKACGTQSSDECPNGYAEGYAGLENTEGFADDSDFVPDSTDEDASVNEKHAQITFFRGRPKRARSLPSSDEEITLSHEDVGAVKLQSSNERSVNGKESTHVESSKIGSSQEKTLNETDVIEDCSQGKASNEPAGKDSSPKIIQDIEPGLRGTSENFEQCSNQVEHSKIGSSQEKTLNETDVIEDCSQGEALNETAGKHSSPKIIQDIEPGLRGTNENVGQCSNQVEHSKIDEAGDKSQETPISVSVSDRILSIDLPFVPFEDLNDIDIVEEFKACGTQSSDECSKGYTEGYAGLEHVPESSEEKTEGSADDSDFVPDSTDEDEAVNEEHAIVKFLRGRPNKRARSFPSSDEEITLSHEDVGAVKLQSSNERSGNFKENTHVESGRKRAKIRASKNSSPSPKDDQSSCSNSDEENGSHSITEAQKSDSSSDDEEFTPDDIVRDVNTPDIYIAKVVTSDTTKSGKCKKNPRVFNSYQHCLLCQKKVSNFSQHLLDGKLNQCHSKSADVQAIKNEVDPDKRKRLIYLLRCKFNHENNVKVIEKGKGQILLERRPTKDSFDVHKYGPCPRCFGWMSLRLLWKHQNNCKKKPKDLMSTAAIVTQSAILAHTITASASQLMKKEVFPYMNLDETGVIARNDHLIIRLGNQWLEKNIGNRLKRGKYTSQIMRLCARLLQNLRKLKPISKTDLWEYLEPQHFEALVEATLLTCMPYMDDITELKSPSNALKLGFDLKRLISIKIGICIEKGKKKQKEEAEDLLKLMAIFWGTKVTKLAKVLLNERQFNKRTSLPEEGDLKKLNIYLKDEMKRLDLSQNGQNYNDYISAVELVQVKLMVYNRRRSGELEAAEKKHYLARKRKGEGSVNLLGECTALERHLIDTQEVMEIRGKTGRGVPVIVPEEAIPVLNFISDDTVRTAAGIDVGHPYLFAKAGKERHMVVSCYEATKKICEAAGLVAPQKISSTSLRKYMATYTQVLDLQGNELEWVINHLGHSMDIHKHHYRATSSEIERSKIAKLLLIQDLGLGEKYANKTLDSIQFKDIIAEKPTEEEPGSSASTDSAREAFFNLAKTDKCPDEVIHEVLHLAEDFFVEEELEEAKSKKKRVPPENRMKWSQQEEEEIKELFKKQFRKKEKPSATKVKAALNESKAKGGAIHTRSVSALKNKVFRMLNKK